MAMNHRIAMISVHECPLASSEGKERGGINVYVFELAKALTHGRWTIDIFTRQQDDRNPIVVKVNPSLRVIHIPCGPHTPLSKTEILRHRNEFIRGMTKFIDHEHIHYELIHAHYYLSGLVAQALSNGPLPHTPWIMTFHTLGLMKQLVNRSPVSDDPKERVPIESILAQQATKIITTSENDRAYVSALYNVPSNHIQTIPPGVDTSLFLPKNTIVAKRAVGADFNHHIVLAVGRIDPVKGFDVLLYAIKILFTKYPALSNTVCVWIVGGDVGENSSMWSSELRKLTLLQQSLSLTTTVRFIPPQPQEKLVDYYNAADVVVMPSHYESFGMVALEAFACDTPVITTDVMGISLMVKEFPKGHVVSANNPVALATKIERVLHVTHKETLRSDAVAVFDWSHIAGRIGNVYDEVIRTNL